MSGVSTEFEKKEAVKTVWGQNAKDLADRVSALESALEAEICKLTG